MPSPPTDFRPSPLFRYLPIFGAIGMLGFTALAVTTALMDKFPLGWWMALFGLTSAGYFTFNFWQVAYTVSTQADHLIIRRLGSEKTIYYHALTTATLKTHTLTFHTPKGKTSLYGDSQSLTHLYTELQILVPSLKQQKQTRLERPLPLHYPREIASDVIAGLGILGVSLFMLGSLIWAWTTGTFLNTLEDWFVTGLLGLFSLILIPVSLLMMFRLVRHITFTETDITVHSLWHKKRYPISALHNIQLKATPLTVRGFSRTFYTLLLTFAGNQTLEITPPFSDSTGTRAAQAKNDLTELQMTLLNHYPLVTITRYNDGTHTVNEWGKGYLLRKFEFHPYNLIIQEEDYGEYYRGVDIIHYHLSRPIVEGITRFRTTNGYIAYTPNGRYLVLYDLHAFIVFDLQQEHAWHQEYEESVFIRKITLEVDHIELLFTPPGLPSLHEGSRFIPLAELDQHLKPGTGTTPSGDFSSAILSRHPAPHGPTPEKNTSTTDSVTELLIKANQLGDRLYDDFESLRDALNALGPDAFPKILQAAQETSNPGVQELLVTVLVDRSYPPAYPDFITWLDHPNNEICYFCASALDQLAGGRFGIDKMNQGGWVQYDRIRATAPAIQEWWERGGMNIVPTLAMWQKQAAKRTPIPDLHKWFNFVELNPMWVKFGDGVVAQKERGFQLPRKSGTHIVGGQVWLLNLSKPVFGAFVMESDPGWVGGVFVKEEGKWVEISERMARAEPNFRF